MKKLLIIVVLLFMVSLLVSADLSDDTLKEVERLRVKYFFDGLEITELISIGHSSIANSDIVWTRDFLHLEVKGNRLIVETQDGKWFIEMQEMEKVEKPSVVDCGCSSIPCICE